jgi:hypothetical protein
LAILAGDAQAILATLANDDARSPERSAGDDGVKEPSANDILKLFWHTLEITLPSEPARRGTAARWLRLLRAVIDSCSTQNGLAHLSRRLAALLRAIIDGVAPGREARALISVGVEHLHQQDRLRLNRLLLEAVFCDPDSPRSRKESFVFDSQVSYWLERLLNVAMEGPNVFGVGNIQTSIQGLRWSGEAPAPPAGALAHERPMVSRLSQPVRWRSEEPIDLAVSLFIDIGFGRPDLQRFGNPCFGPEPSRIEIAPPLLSSGFHQLCPIVVQSALMYERELLAIENPEVHLHPALQLKVAEFLIEQAQSGRLLVIETHSDLIIRRVLRAILEESISQEQLRIYFTDLADGPQGYKYATLERLQTNQKGQIINWPAGFLDADVRESERLLDIMYGGVGRRDDDADDNTHETENGA